MKISKLWEIVTGHEKQRARVMRRSWVIAKCGQKKFGGSSKQYLSLSMKQAWSYEQKN